MHVCIALVMKVLARVQDSRLETGVLYSKAITTPSRRDFLSIGLRELRLSESWRLESRDDWASPGDYGNLKVSE